jgi:hypothetical protein
MGTGILGGSARARMTSGNNEGLTSINVVGICEHRNGIPPRNNFSEFYLISASVSLMSFSV